MNRQGPPNSWKLPFSFGDWVRQGPEVSEFVGLQPVCLQFFNFKLTQYDSHLTSFLFLGFRVHRCSYEGKCGNKYH
jgi:hypothetical protein